MLLDGETSFAIYAADGGRQEQSVSRLTLSKSASLDQADFIFFPDPSLDASIVIERCREGTLEDPQLGATLIFRASAIESGGPLILTGPGIERETAIGIERAGDWLEARRQKNREYPLGVDAIFITDDGRLAAIPRTTKIAVRPEAQ